MINVQDIVAADWSMKLDGAVSGDGLGDVVQGIDDVNQCIVIICTTPKGTDPLRPLFAIDVTKYIDLPMTSAIPALVSEFADAITNFEPRVILIAINAVPILTGAQAGAQLKVLITWRLKLDGSEPRSTLVTIPWSA